MGIRMSGSGKKINELFIKNRLIIFMLSLIVVKQLLVIGLPLFAHAGAGHDDRLMINMANSLVNGEWLGQYNDKTLVKGIFFPLFLVGNDYLGIPYTVSIPGFYGIACMVFVFGIKNLFKTEAPLYLVFAVLIFNPISLGDETFLRVYRNSLTPAQVLIVSGSMFAIYLNREKKSRIQLFWAITGGLGLASLWHTREDGIWILPLILGVISVTVFSILLESESRYKKKAWRVIITVIPLGMLLLSTMLIAGLNSVHYGIYTNNEISKSEFTKAIKMIYSVQPSEDVFRASVPRSTMEMIYKVSPSLSAIRTELDGSLDRWSWYEENAKVRQVEDGFFIWALREAVSNSGYYEDAIKAETFYKNVVRELEIAFESGELIERATMPSALMSPWRDIYLEKLPTVFFDTIDYIAGFRAIKISMTDSFDDGQNGILLFEEVTNSKAYRSGDQIGLINQIRLTALNGMIGIYQVFGQIIFIAALISYGVITLLLILGKWRKRYLLLDCWLVLSALLFSVAVLALGVAYTDISAYVAISYWYLAGAYPLMAVFNVIAIYKMAEIIVSVIIKKQKNADLD